VIEDKQSLVAIHDGVRPFVQKQVIEKSFEIAKDKGNAITVIKLKDSIRQKTYAENTKSVDRNDFYLVQTPQTFHTSLIFEAYQQENINHLTDDASVLENYGHPINVIEGSYENIKITTPEDMLVANAFYENLKYHHKKI
jgi:2-C-methyl-D-erythritol 4-phosphate cytidylyltransferase